MRCLALLGWAGPHCLQASAVWRLYLHLARLRTEPQWKVPQWKVPFWPILSRFAQNSESLQRVPK